MTAALNVAAQPAPTAPPAAPHGVKGKPSDAPVFASIMEALAQSHAHPKAPGDTATSGGDLAHAARKDASNAKPSTPMPADAVKPDAGASPLAFALALPAPPPALPQTIASHPSEAAPPKANAWGPRLSPATESALSLAPTNAAPLEQSATQSAPSLAPTQNSASALSLLAVTPQAAPSVGPVVPDLGARSIKTKTFLGLDRLRVGNAETIAAPGSAPHDIAPPVGAHPNSLLNEAPAKAVAADHKKAAPPETPAAAPIAPALAGASGESAFNGAMSLAGPIGAEQLPHFITANVRDLLPASAPDLTALPAPIGQHVVRELDVELAPAGLGTVLVKMRLNNGKLSVVLEVSSASALRAVQGEQDAISVSLSSSAQPLGSLTIKQTDSSHTQGDNRDASNSQRDPREDRQTGSDRAPRQGQSSNRRDPPAQRASPPPMALRGRADGLLV